MYWPVVRGAFASELPLASSLYTTIVNMADEEPTEFLATRRSKRSTAGNRYAVIITVAGTRNNNVWIKNGDGISGNGH